MSEQQDHSDEIQDLSWVNFITPVSAVAGFALTVYGVAQIYEPLGFLVAGLLLLALAIKGAQE